MSSQNSTFDRTRERGKGRDEGMENSTDVEPSDNVSLASRESDESCMESFEDFAVRISQLLDCIGFHDFSVDAIQHGYGFSNCVYGLTSSKLPAEQYILRVAISGAIRESDGRHETLENDIALLGHLEHKLPVARTKAYSLTADNGLEAAYTIQTRIPGQSLDKLWTRMEILDKQAVVDQYIDLLAKLETVTFTTTGTFASSTPLPVQASSYCAKVDPLVCMCHPNQEESSAGAISNLQQSGMDLKGFLNWHLDTWIQDEIDSDRHKRLHAVGPRLKKLQEILSDMDKEGSFQKPSSVVLHHWDLEPRNIMVSQINGSYIITGIIDWDDALAMPLPLSRIPPRWIWHYPDSEPELEDGFLTWDQYPDPELSEENQALKAYFDNKIEKKLPGYCEDAYGSGRWLRRIWYFAETGAYKTWAWDFLDQIPVEWAARPKPQLISPCPKTG